MNEKKKDNWKTEKDLAVMGAWTAMNSYLMYKTVKSGSTGMRIWLVISVIGGIALTIWAQCSGHR